jgi:uncharacterized protein YjbJ (UPF0337 family)
MSTKDKLEATKKNLEGKGQELVGEVTGDKSEKVKGKTKPGEASVEHEVENVKEKI